MLLNDLHRKFPEVTLSLEDKKQKWDLNGPPPIVKGAFLFLFQQLGKRFSLSYPQIRDVAFEISGPPAPGRPTQDSSPERKLKKTRVASGSRGNDEGENVRSYTSSKDSNSVAAALAVELERWKENYKNCQDSAKIIAEDQIKKIQQIKLESEKSLAEKDQKINELEKSLEMRNKENQISKKKR